MCGVIGYDAEETPRLRSSILSIERMVELGPGLGFSEEVEWAGLLYLVK